MNYWGLRLRGNTRLSSGRLLTVRASDYELEKKVLWLACMQERYHLDLFPIHVFVCRKPVLVYRVAVGVSAL